jgi:DNA primase
LALAVETYQAQLAADSAGVAYLQSRGLSKDSATYFRLGAVRSPILELGHEPYAGMLCIPYLTPAGPVSLRFRALPDADGQVIGPKYRSMPGDMPRLFNPSALLQPGPYVAICEGEFDTMTAVQAGIPAVGAAGVSSWRPAFSRAFRGYRKVFILADSDDKGQGMAFGEKLADEIENAVIVPMPLGHDVNSFVLEQGPEALRERLGLSGK